MVSEPEKVLGLLALVFDQLGIAFAVGGSIASSAYGIPRATLDVDILADIRAEHVERFVDAVQKEFYVSIERTKEAVRFKTSFSLIHLTTMMKADIFPAKPGAWAREEFSRSRKHRLETEREAVTVPFSSPEDNILHKLEWFRMGGEVSRKQWDDVLGVMQIQAVVLDRDYLKRWAKELGLEHLLAKAVQEAGLVE